MQTISSDIMIIGSGVGGSAVATQLAAILFAACRRTLKFPEHIIYKWLHQDPERSGLVKAARKIAAERLADEALDLADNVEADTVAISKVREQISVRKWRAALGCIAQNKY